MAPKCPRGRDINLAYHAPVLVAIISFWHGVCCVMRFWWGFLMSTSFPLLAKPFRQLDAIQRMESALNTSLLRTVPRNTTTYDCYVLLLYKHKTVSIVFCYIRTAINTKLL